ncbi:DUF1566 domain-containing protein [Limnohabitans sp. WS1]|uniref:Lcl domain-containing protein n=1 Tax=Limnohabitans sp. WS1 TaxID=1100726 RepID=UPI001304C981|nr:DUF1566 domain-containing protein [Limnohabitans sp. WS1]
MTKPCYLRSANRAGKGSHAAVDRLHAFMRQRNGHGWLMCRYLYTRKSSGGGALRSLCHKLLAQTVQEWCADPAAAVKVPPHKRLRNAPAGCGLPIGNLTSQFFANVYLNELDQFVKQTLKAKHYVSYVGDFVLLAPNAATLRQWYDQIAQFLQARLSLRLKDEPRLAPLAQGVDFLGYVLYPSHRLVRRRVVAHCKGKLSAWAQRHVTFRYVNARHARLDRASMDSRLRGNDAQGLHNQWPLAVCSVQRAKRLRNPALCLAANARRQPRARQANRLAAPRHQQARNHSLPNFYGDRTMNKPLFASLLAATLFASTVRAQICPTWPTADRFTLNGAEVIDKRTGLTWKRCSEGQNWNGSTCTGSATLHNHEAALTLAKAANTSQSATLWRLPNVKELASLADNGCQPPAIDNMAFPATPPSSFWSSSPDVGDASYAWYVYFGYGNVYRLDRGNHYVHVRLVRASQ